MQALGRKEVTMKRLKLRDHQAFVGCAWRSPVTGLVQLTGVEESSDFTLVDLWTRHAISGTPDQMEKEKYLFKPTVLATRTWIFQSTFEARKLEYDAGEVEPCVRKALESKCVDTPGNSGGRKSPVMNYVFMLPVVAFTGNFLVIAFCAATFMITLFVGVNMCTPNLYMYARPSTVLLRLIFLVILIGATDIGGLLSREEYFSLAALFITIVIALHDHLAGDVAYLLSFSQMSYFEILTELPQRVYVCRIRGGGAAKGRQKVNIIEGITGMRAWSSSRDLALVADVHGILCELTPVPLSEWEKLATFVSVTGEDIKYAGANLFNVQRQTLHQLEDVETVVKDPWALLVNLKDGRTITRREAEKMHMAIDDTVESSEDSEEENAEEELGQNLGTAEVGKRAKW